MILPIIGKVIYYGLSALELGLNTYDAVDKKLRTRKRKKEAEKKRRADLIRKINEP